jgi:hypothetical protein
LHEDVVVGEDKKRSARRRDAAVERVPATSRTTSSVRSVDALLTTISSRGIADESDKMDRRQPSSISARLYVQTITDACTL